MFLSNIISTVTSQASKTPLHVRHPGVSRPHKNYSHTTIHSFPAEIITELFYLITFEANKPHILIPVDLSHVCRRWRAIAFRTSNLWTSIITTFPCPREDIERMRMSLILSRKRPLDIYIDLRDQNWDLQDDDSHDMQADDMFRIFDLTSGDAHRWRYLEILADNWQPIHAFLALSTSFASLPTLERLSLSRCNSYYGVSGNCFAPLELKAPIALFGGNTLLPRLRHATLAGVHIDWARSSGLKDLEELELKYLASDVVPTMEDFLRIIRDSPRLAKFTLTGCVPQSTTPNKPNKSSKIHVAIPTLKSFNFGWSDTQEAMELLEMFQFASLEELSLEDVLSSLYHGVGQDSSPVVELLLRLGCSTPGISSPRAYYPLSCLRKLTLTAVNIDVVFFQRLLENAPNLEEIVLKGVDVSWMKLIGVEASPLLPKLKRLEVRFPERVAETVNEALEHLKVTREGLKIEGIELNVADSSESEDTK